MSEYFVNFLEGRDSNSGTTEGAPVKTWNAANIGGGTFAPGDVIRFREGVVYPLTGGRLQFALSSAPSAASPVTFTTYGGTGRGRAVFDGGGTRDIGIMPPACDAATPGRYCKFQKFEIRNFTLAGVYLSEASADGSHDAYHLVEDCWVHHMSAATQAGIQSWGIGTTIRRNIVDHCGGDSIWFYGAANYIGHNTVTDGGLATAVGGDDCIQAGGASPRSIVEYNYLDKGPRPWKQAILVLGDGVQVRYNTCLGLSDGAGLITVWNSTGAQVLGNLLLGRDGIYLLDTTGQCRVQANVIISTVSGSDDGQSTGIDANNQGHLYYHNTIVGHRRGIYGQGNTIRNNVIASCSVVGLYAGTGVVSETYNVLYGNTRNKYDNASQDVALDGTDLTVDPQFDARYMPQAASLRAGGSYVGGHDLYGKEFWAPPTIGAVQYQPPRALVSSRELAFRRAMA